MSSSIPSLRFHFLTPFYDFLFGVLLPEKRIRQTLLDIGSLRNPECILEIGCGTGSFTVMISQRFLSASITAIDTDEKAIFVLTKKIEKLEIENINTRKLSATILPFEDVSHDTIYSSLLFCNLNYNEKLKTIAEAKRVLTWDGEFLIAEWAKPQAFIGKVGFNILQWVGGKANTEDLKNGMLATYLQQAGFIVTVKHSLNTLFGTIVFYNATVLK